jgi:hypothetical protein
MGSAINNIKVNLFFILWDHITTTSEKII